jgi:hypothetical protein
MAFIKTDFAKLIVFCLLICVSVVHFCEAESPKIKWIENTFEDFIDGTLDASGQNVYVRRDGAISTIRRYDINNDGYLDLFFGNTHDEKTVVPPVIVSIDKQRNIKYKDLDVLGSDKVYVSDLNLDGRDDLIFSLKNDGLQSSRRFLTILYGHENGWSHKRSTGYLTANNPLDLVVADINADGWPDIVVVNKPYLNAKYIPKENIRVYLGSKNGFQVNNFINFDLPEVRWLVAEDFNKDGFKDFAALSRAGSVHIVLSSNQKDTQILKMDLPADENKFLCLAAADVDLDENIDLVIGTDKELGYLIRGKGNGKWFKPEKFDSLPASHITLSDIDNDSYPDMILNYLAVGVASMASTSAADETSDENIYILWGSKNGFSVTEKTKLPGKYAYATSAGDIDGDGYCDIAVAVFQGQEKYSAQSLVYFGRPKRKFVLAKQKIPTEGASDVKIIEAKSESNGTIVFSNKVSGTLHEKVPVYVYWGGAEGFNKTNRLEIMGVSGHQATAADINNDGFTDLLVTFTAHGGVKAFENPLSGTNIFWGSEKGFDTENRRTILKKPFKNHCNVADFNKDGYLDVVLGGWDPWLGPDKGKPAEIAIYYGSETGIGPGKYISIESPGGSEGVVIADYNKDSWLDIAVTSPKEDKVRVFWNSANGFSSENQQKLYGAYPIGIEAADMDSDGFLDLIVANYQDKISGLFDMGVCIFWGSQDGYRQWDSQWLRGNCVEGPLVADFDSDGFLDVFFPNYHTQNRRDTIPSSIYWGSSNGLGTQNRTHLICDSASGAFGGDFDGDGLIDLAVSCHTTYGNHNINSKVFYNDGNRFSKPETISLPTIGSHFMYGHDMGHIYNRKYQQYYESSVFESKTRLSKGQLDYDANVPKGTNLTFFIRSVADKKNLSKANWREVTKNVEFDINQSDRYLQYKVLLLSSNGDRYPIIHKVVMSLN